MKRILILTSILGLAGYTYGMQLPGENFIGAPVGTPQIENKIWQTFNQSSTLAEYLEQQQAIVTSDINTTAKPTLSFLQEVLKRAHQYKEQHEQLLAGEQKAGINLYFLLGGTILTVSGLYLVARLPIAYYTQSTAGLRWLFLPISRFVTAIGYDASLIRKGILGCELAAALYWGPQLARDAGRALHLVVTIKQRLQKRIDHINCIIQYFEQEIAILQSQA